MVLIRGNYQLINKANAIFSYLEADNYETISEFKYIQFCLAIALDEELLNLHLYNLDE